ncbi:MAG: RelA/SpoT family protein [Gammaproteobacteria bacterium]|nr:RelA/SpoT family protein [Gammaproteobacteria bacterium]MBT8151662.1 RelA/SpoT family protein [Gammaproteobacteria bacterium]NND38902.1 RelA/SpoT family protein [Pseudomonadales bacterium]RZV50665.1 MAG: RelA/SpoT family protein [Pseudomonadales bacterium]
MQATIDTLTHKLGDYLDNGQIELVRNAYFYASEAHEGQKRRSGEPYVTHPLAVADILADMHMDHQSLAAAMLHDVIEDTGVDKAALDEVFGETVAELVDGVSKLTQFEFRDHAQKQAENFQKMAMAMARDLRVIMVKLADRLHNMRTLDVLSLEKRRRIAKETLEIYAPIANRLGMNDVRVEFEDLGFATLYPMRARRIQVAVESVRGNRKQLIADIRNQIAERLMRDGIHVTVMGREKHLYSIYQKMRTKNVSFAEIMDVFAFRIIVDSVDDCYRTLGSVHNLYKPRPGNFKDYIAIPKANGYQSLHTVLFGMHGVPIEIQIRTTEMEKMANNGIAAHWLYKAQQDDSEATVGSHMRARQWVQGLLELQENAGNSLEFIENVKIDLFPEEVYVFTPRGDIMELPVGATPIDFAYAVHTDIGNACVGCKINRRLSTLSQPLDSGQTVEVITAHGAKPNPAWLDIVVTSRARSQIRHYLKHQRRGESIELGQRLLNKALLSHGSGLDELQQQQISQLLESAGARDFNQLLEEIGQGDRIAQLTAKQLLGVETGVSESELAISSTARPLVIAGTEGMMINFAKCCNPIPGDDIGGHITAGRGVVVHVADCRNFMEILRNDKEGRSVNLRWHDDVLGEYRVELQVHVEQRRGIIALLASKINSLDASLESIRVEERDARSSVIHIFLSVRDRVHLARVIRRIRVIKSVARVTRVKL